MSKILKSTFWPKVLILVVNYLTRMTDKNAAGGTGAVSLAWSRGTTSALMMRRETPRCSTCCTTAVTMPTSPTVPAVLCVTSATLTARTPPPPPPPRTAAPRRSISTVVRWGRAGSLTSTTAGGTGTAPPPPASPSTSSVRTTRTATRRCSTRPTVISNRDTARFNIHFADGCNYEKYTDCGERPVCDPCGDNCVTPTPGPVIDCGHDLDCSSKPSGWYPDPYSCVKYWNCNGNRATHYICPDGQMYEPVKVLCDYPDRVQCGSRPPCNECLDGCP